MDGIEAVGIIKKAVLAHQQEGKDSVDLAALARYLEEVEQSLPESIEVSLQ